MPKKSISLTLILMLFCHGASLAAGPNYGLRPRAAGERNDERPTGPNEKPNKIDAICAVKGTIETPFRVESFEGFFPTLDPTLTATNSDSKENRVQFLEPDGRIYFTVNLNVATDPAGIKVGLLFSRRARYYGPFSRDAELIGWNENELYFRAEVPSETATFYDIAVYVAGRRAPLFKTSLQVRIVAPLDACFNMLADGALPPGSSIIDLYGYLFNAASAKWGETEAAKKKKKALLETFDKLMMSDYFPKERYGYRVRKEFYQAVYYITEEILKNMSTEFIPILDKFRNFARSWGDSLEVIREYAGEEADPFRIFSMFAAGPEATGRKRFITALNELRQIFNFVEVADALRFRYGNDRMPLAEAKIPLIKETGTRLREIFQKYLVRRKIGHKGFRRGIRDIMGDLGMRLPRFILGEDVPPKEGSAFHAFRDTADLGDFLIFLCTAPYEFDQPERRMVVSKVGTALRHLMNMSEEGFNTWLNEQSDWNWPATNEMKDRHPELACLYQDGIQAEISYYAAKGKPAGAMSALVNKDFLWDIEVGLRPNPECLSLTYGVNRQDLLLYSLDSHVLFMKIIGAQEAKGEPIADCQIVIIPGQGAVVFPVYAKPGLVRDETKKNLVTLSTLECLAEFAKRFKKSLPHIAVVGNADLLTPREEAIDLAQTVGHYTVSSHPERLQKRERADVSCEYEGVNFKSELDSMGVRTTSFSTRVWATADTLRQAASDLREELVREGVVFSPLPEKVPQPLQGLLIESQVLRPQAAGER